jgi:hypothetical protein
MLKSESKAEIEHSREALMARALRRHGLAEPYVIFHVAEASRGVGNVTFHVSEASRGVGNVTFHVSEASQGGRQRDNSRFRGLPRGWAT